MNRVLRLAFVGLVAASSPLSAQEPKLQTAKTYSERGNRNVLTAQEAKAGFELLFNGRDLQGWVRDLQGRYPEPETGDLRIDDGAIYVINANGLTYRGRKLPDDFELRFEWRESKVDNNNGRNGLTFSKGPPSSYPAGADENLKIQLASATCGFEAGGRWVCLSGLLKVGENGNGVTRGFGETTNPSRTATRPLGQWNEGRILHKGTVIQHWVNGQKVIDFDCATKQNPIDPSLTQWINVKKHGMYLCLVEDPLLESHPTWYRGFTLRRLGKDEKLDGKELKPIQQ